MIAREADDDAGIGIDRQVQRCSSVKKGARVHECLCSRLLPSLRGLSDTRREEVGFRRFFRNKKVTASEIVATAAKRTGEAAAGLHVLVIEDTTEVNYEAKSGRKRGLGSVGNGTDRGLFVHGALAVDAESGAVLGLAGAVIWNRTKVKATNYQDLLIEEKESFRWIDGFRQAAGCLGAARLITLVTDREGDIYELLCSTADAAHLIIRTTHDRGVNDIEKRLFARLKALPVAATVELALPARDGQPKRKARLELRYGAVRLRRPSRGMDPRYPAELTLNCVEAREIDAPEGVAPLLWRLYTTHEVTTPEEAQTIVRLYRQRWIIEQMHRTMKSRGVNIEECLLADARALEAYAATAVSAAVRVMQLVQARGPAGDVISASRVFCPEEIEVLDAVIPKFEGRTEKQKNAHPAHSLSWAAWGIARLGGWKGYASERPPGPETFAIGLRRFTAIAEGFAIARGTDDKKADNIAPKAH